MRPQTRASVRATTQPQVESPRGTSDTMIIATDEATPESSDSEPEMESRPRKIARKAQLGSGAETAIPSKYVRGKKGRLSGLMNMPIDVFTEIAVHLYPLDLVLLARANKFFRQMLMSRSAIHIWRSAERNVEGLPPCPKELCEPQYAALVFTKYCSICGNQALRPMDAILQVRLCVSCRDQQLTRGDPQYAPSGLVSTSHNIVPGKRFGWSLCRDIEEVDAKWQELTLAGDEAEKKHWEEEQVTAVYDRWEEAQPLIKFLKKIDFERDAELTELKNNRQKEIENRLLKIGWEVGDFRVRDRERIRPWNSLVNVAKPLTDRAWEKLLPQLVVHLEKNRTKRIEAELQDRKRYRNTEIFRWLGSYMRQLSPYVKALGPFVRKNIDSANSPSGEPSAYPDLAPLQSAARNVKVPSPSIHHIVSWSLFQTLLATDVPNESFSLQLDAIRPELDELLAAWKSNLEKSLIKALLDASKTEEKATPGVLDTKPSSGPALIPEYEFLVDGCPFSTLPLDTKQLLRADTVFTTGGLLYFYPDSFVDVWSGSGYDYHMLASRVAKSLLFALGHPEATHLQLMAAGSIFSCGRCCVQRRVTWQTMLKHYVSENSHWETVRKSSKFKENTISYIYTHDIEVVHPQRPLIVIANEEAKTGDASRYTFHTCRICEGMGVPIYYNRQAEIMEHLNEVHLIQEPKSSEHYKSF